MLKALSLSEIQAAIAASKARCNLIHEAHKTYRHGKGRGVFEVFAKESPKYRGHAVLARNNKCVVPRNYVPVVTVPVGAFI